jgi:hypothetical protein
MPRKSKTTWDIHIPDEIMALASEGVGERNLARRRVFSDQEDRLLLELVVTKECTNWCDVSKRLGHKSPRQCRDRWMNYLSPANSFLPWTFEEVEMIVEKVNDLGTRWTAIARFLPGRSDNSIKNRWYSALQAMCQIGNYGRYCLKDRGKEEQQATRSISISSEKNGDNSNLNPGGPRITLTNFVIPEMEKLEEPDFPFKENEQTVDFWDCMLSAHMSELNDPFGMENLTRTSTAEKS